MIGVGALAVALGACSAAGSEGSKLLAPEEGLPHGVVAEDLTLDAPFTLQLAPSVSGPGGVFNVWAKGNLSEGWMGTVYANIDREIGGTWRTLWIISEDAHPSDPHRVESSSGDSSPIAVGVGVDQQLLFAVPDDVPVGIYRICREYVHEAADDKQAYVCAPLTIEPTAAAR